MMKSYVVSHFFRRAATGRSGLPRRSKVGSTCAASRAHGRHRGPRRYNSTKASESAEEPLISTKLKIKLGTVASVLPLLYGYNKLNKDPEFRKSMDASFPAAMGHVRSWVDIDSVKLEDVKQITVWDDEDVWGDGIDPNLETQTIRAQTGFGSYFVLKAGPTDTPTSLRAACIAKGMSVDDTIADISFLEDNGAKTEPSRSVVENSNVNTAESKDTMLKELSNLREEEVKLRDDVRRWQSIKGGGIRVDLLSAQLKELEDKKAIVKQYIKMSGR
jgi:hypothetical protein